jgi:hypothetical protein
VVEEVQSTFRGMEIAIEADDWKPLALMSVILFAEFLRDCASQVNLKRSYHLHEERKSGVVLVGKPDQNDPSSLPTRRNMNPNILMFPLFGSSLPDKTFVTLTGGSS